MPVTLLLLAGVGMGGDSWRWTRASQQEGAQPHDYPGIGSRKRERHCRSLTEAVDDIVRRYGGPLDVVGVSYGGIIGLHLAVRHPDRVRSLLTACCGARTRRETAMAWAESSRGGFPAEQIERIVDRWLGPPGTGRPSAAEAYLRDVLAHMDTGGFRDAWLAMATHDVTADLPEIRCPVTCLAADGDAGTTGADVDELARSMPRARSRTEHGPHLLPVARPEAFDRVLDEHLRWALAA